jgi:O-antigen/teichoic acid export membrane protein
MNARIKGSLHTALMRAGAWLKTDMYALVKSGFWLNLNFLTSALLSLLFSVIVAHFLSKDVYGTYQYVLSLAGIIGVFSLTGMNSAVTRAVARGNEGAMKQSIPIQLAWGTVSLLIALGTGMYYYLHGNSELALSLAAIGFLQPIANAANTYAPFLNGRKNFRALYWYDTVSNIIYVVSMALTILYGPHVLYLVFVYFFGTMLVDVGLYLYTLVAYKPNDKTDDETMRYGAHLSAINILGTIASKIDSVLVFHFLGPVELAIYSFAKIIPTRMGELTKVFGTIAMPNFAARSHSDILATLVRKTLLLALFGAALAVAYSLIAPLFFHIFFPAYEGSVVYSQVFSWSLIAGASNITTAVLLSQKMQKRLYVLNIVNPTVQLVLLFVFLYWMGLWGAIISRVVWALFSVLFTLYLATKKVPEENTQTA